MRLLVHGLGGELIVQQYPDDSALKYADIQTGALRDNLQEAIQRVKGRYGPEEFCGHLKKDAQFQDVAQKLICWSFFSDQNQKEFVLTDEVMKLIDIPDWDELVLAGHSTILQYLGRNPRTARDRVGFCNIFPCRAGDQVTIRPSGWGVVHSLAVQLCRQPGSCYYGDRLPIAHVCFMITVPDRLLVLGVRAGSYERNKISLVPAGSAAWPSFKKSRQWELSQELNVSSQDLVRPPRLAGMYSYQGRLISVSVIETKLSSLQVLERWENAQDKHEHKKIFFYPVDDLNSRSICRYLENAHKTNASWSEVSWLALKVGAAYYFNDIQKLQGGFTNEVAIFSSI